MNKGPKIKRPNLALRLLELTADDSYNHSVSGDCEEMYADILIEHGRIKAFIWMWKQVLRSTPLFIFNSFVWSIIMISNYLKICMRNFRKNKGYSFINISGLAIGMACCTLIFLYVNHELGYDKYHADADRLYRIVMNIKMGVSDFGIINTSGPLVPTLREKYPEVETAARISTGFRVLVDRDNSLFYENRFFYAEKDIFDILRINFIKGNPETAITRKNTMVITVDMADKYFKNEDPLGKIININRTDFEITGIIQNPPENTHLKYNIIASIHNHFQKPEDMIYWQDTYTPAYIKLKPGVNAEEFREKIRQIAHNYKGDYFKKRGWTYTCLLQKVKDIHLYSRQSDELEPPGSILYIYSLSIIGFFILIIAYLNFINLSTARAAYRAKEIGIRKVAGAQKSQLIYQFIGESLTISAIAFIFSLLLFVIALPYFNSLVDRNFTISILFRPFILFSILFFIIFSGITAGIYPALSLSRFSPAAIISNRFSAGKSKSTLRSVFVICQFVISIILITGTIVVFSQINFMKNQHLGFDKEQKIVFSARINNNHELIKNEFMKHQGITGATASDGIPGRILNTITTRLIGGEKKEIIMPHLFCDFNFLDEYKIEMAAGIKFTKNIISDIGKAYIINETAARSFGWKNPEDALGKILESGGRGPEHRRKIIGVVKDFHFSGLQNEIGPLVMIQGHPGFRFRIISLTVKATNLTETISFIENKWKELKLGNVFVYTFLDEDFDRFYRSEEKVSRIFTTFSCMAIFLSCIGLLSLSSFIAAQRTKEVGIRKVLGASVPGVFFLLVKEFIKWVVLAAFIASPIAWYLMNQWLLNFAYCINPGFSVFLLSGLSLLLTALVTVAFQTIKAATANPVKALKFE